MVCPANTVGRATVLRAEPDTEREMAEVSPPIRTVAQRGGNDTHRRDVAVKAPLATSHGGHCVQIGATWDRAPLRPRAIQPASIRLSIVPAFGGGDGGAQI
jgi:hypothetical protein